VPSYPVASPWPAREYVRELAATMAGAGRDGRNFAKTQLHSDKRHSLNHRRARAVALRGQQGRGARGTASLRAVIAMGSRIWRAILTPKFALAAAVLIAFAVGAYLTGTYFKSAAHVSHAATNAAPPGRHVLKPQVKSNVKVKHSRHLKRTHGPKRKPKPRTDPTPHSPNPAPSSPAPGSPTSPAPSKPPTTSPAPAPVTSIPAGTLSCNNGPDTWSGDAGKVGYSVQETQASNGHLSSFAVVLNASKGNTEVVGYPSDQCLTYSAIPKTLTSSFDVTPPADSSGLDYEYAYDIWLTTASAASSSNWNNDLELMIWTYVHGQVPLGSVVATLNDGSKVYVSGDNTTGTVSVMLPGNETKDTVDIAGIISQLRALGRVASADTGILDVEYGIEAPYGGGQAFKVNGFSVTAG
jgi:hypothetical protein